MIYNVIFSCDGNAEFSASLLVFSLMILQKSEYSKKKNSCAA